MGMVPDVYGEDVASFASLRVPAWHGLGVVLEEELTIAEFKIAALLSGLNERKVSADELSGILGITALPFTTEQYFVIRNNPINGGVEILAPVGSRYEVFTTDELFGFAEQIMGGKNETFRVETAGGMDGGRRIFIAMAKDEDIVLDEGGQADRIERYLLVSSTHDGSGKVIAKSTNVRVVCQNTLDMALKGHGTTFTLRHTVNMRDRAIQAEAAMGFSRDYDTLFAEIATSLIETNITNKQFGDMVNVLFPERDEDGRGKTVRNNKVDEIWSVWGGDTGSMDNLGKNAWRALNTLTEHSQWFATPRKTKNGAENFWAAGAGFDALATKKRQDAFEVVTSLI